MPYYDRPLTGAVGRNSLLDLLKASVGGNSVYPAFSTVQLIFPSSNAGAVGVGDTSLAALGVAAYLPGTETSYPSTARPNFHDLTQIYLWFEVANDVVQFRGTGL
jgi:hypothetical protein